MNIAIKDVLKQIRPFFIPYLVLILVCLLIKLLFTREQIYFTVNGLHYSWADAIAPYVTDVGDGWTIIGLSILLLFFSYRDAFLMITTWAITSLSAQIIKHLFNKPRPTLYFQSQLSRIHLVKGVFMLKHDSFPSGHTVNAFSAVLVITYLVNDKRWGLLLFFIAVAVGYSRMYMSEHFFEDVSAGSVIGVVLTVIWLAYIDKKKFIHTAWWNRGLI